MSDLLKEIYQDSKSFGKEVYGGAQTIGSISTTFQMVVAIILTIVFLFISYKLYNQPQSQEPNAPPPNYTGVYICLGISVITGLFAYYLYTLKDVGVYQAGAGLATVKKLF